MQFKLAYHLTSRRCLTNTEQEGLRNYIKISIYENVPIKNKLRNRHNVPVEARGGPLRPVAACGDLWMCVRLSVVSGRWRLRRGERSVVSWALQAVCSR